MLTGTNKMWPLSKIHNSPYLKFFHHQSHNSPACDNSVNLAFCDYVTQCRLRSLRKAISALFIILPYLPWRYFPSRCWKSEALTKQQVPSPCLRAHTLHLLWQICLINGIQFWGQHWISINHTSVCEALALSFLWLMSPSGVCVCARTGWL